MTTAVGQGPATVLINKIRQLEISRKREISRHKRFLEEVDREIAEAKHHLELVEAGLAPEMIETAEKIIFISGDTKMAAGGALEDAINDVAAGFDKLRKECIGAKRYDRFHQRCDVEYGFGPKHGTIVFAVGMTDECRGQSFTPEEIEACVRYLRVKGEGGRSPGLLAKRKRARPLGPALAPDIREDRPRPRDADTWTVA